VSTTGEIRATPAAAPQRVAAARVAKRTIDLAGAVLALLVFAPLMLAIALAIRLDSPGPVLFSQRRVGRGGGRFVLRKFRTMVIDAEQMRPALLAISRDPNWLDVERDPRVTRLGWFLRKTSLDELPQLWNVLRGEMSLVGPRPLIPMEYEKVPAWAGSRIEVLPGITGLWQVAGRTHIPFEQMLELDRQYVRSWSLGADIRILLRTIPAVLARRGAN
jgi:lipopolysaccharide/colanic/teichoic acid biosynthesis glycosyltransferase